MLMRAPDKRPLRPLTPDQAYRYAAAMMTPAQIRAARAMLGWKQSDLAKASGISDKTIRHVETDGADAKMSTLLAIKAALEAGGIVFLEAGTSREGGPGLRLKG